jgi:hypothetical protein
MDFMHAHMRPGTVLDIIDNHGTIRASVPGLFSSQDEDCLPPIRVFNISGSNSFSSPNIGDEVWVLFFDNNPEELRWFRKDPFEKNNGSRNKNGSRAIDKADASTGQTSNIQDQKDVEVICSRTSGAGWATIYFSDGTGWVIQNQSAVIQISPKGTITLSTGQAHSTIEINDDGISLGSKGESKHPAAHGDKVADLFDNIINTLLKISEAAKGSPYTTSIAAAIDAHVPTYQDDSQYINSDIVTLD